ncbi:MAG: signal peptidase I [Acidimicrobiales bacterium]
MTDELAPDRAPAPGEGARRERRGPAKARSRNRWALEWLLVIVVALAGAYAIKTFLVQAFVIPSGSMQPTLKIGDRVLVSKLNYRFGEVQRGDIVVFHNPTPRAEQGRDDFPQLIKRVIGLPGDVLQATAPDYRVKVNGVALEEAYLGPGVRTRELESPVEVPPGHVFVMGDNRANSRDSRFIGPIEENDIIGEAFLRIWPLNRFGRP